MEGEFLDEAVERYPCQRALQGYLAHKKTPPLSPWDPTVELSLEPYGGPMGGVYRVGGRVSGRGC